jgi:hypothetical protein
MMMKNSGYDGSQNIIAKENACYLQEFRGLTQPAAVIGDPRDKPDYHALNVYQDGLP